MSLRRWWSGVRLTCALLFCASLLTVSATTVSGASSEGPSQFPREYLERTMSLIGRTSLSKSDVRAALRAARDAGVDAYVVRAPMLTMVQYARVSTNGSDIPRTDMKVVRSGWRIPMQSVALATELVRRIAGNEIAAVLERGEIAIGETSASIRDASVGDVITVLDRRNRKTPLVVGAIVPDAFTGDGDLLISATIADQLGVRTVRRVTFVGFDSENQVRRSLARRGIQLGAMYRLFRSWGPQNPDSALGLAKVKKMFGEFAYQRVNGKGVLVDPQWKSKNIAHRITYSDVQLNHNCHVKVIGAIQDALTEIKEKGLEREIDLGNSNRYGGCYVGRFSRLATDNFGAVSRHAWGIAFDINTSTNAQGRVPQMNCEVVRIFRKHGFSWGGNYLLPDGMHFEYVGEPRHNIDYPSTYCPN